MSDRNDWILSVPPDCPDCGAPMQFVRRREYVNKPDAAEYRCPDCGSRLVTRESAERQRRELRADGHLDGEADRVMTTTYDAAPAPRFEAVRLTEKYGWTVSDLVCGTAIAPMRTWDGPTAVAVMAALNGTPAYTAMFRWFEL
ncbi:MAG TPA: hypothetical protein VOB72_08505, partial [Candidatus Dormibacteraeota bacterium]|nr:hypothetical protein [Candidatus Dormibacteraeota bacterium]